MGTNGCSNTLSNPMVENVDIFGEILHPMVENDDVIREIHLRADPACIFNYILVSKRWLNLISSHSFKREYMKRWNMKEQDFKLIGFLVYDLWPVDFGLYYPLPPAVQLLPTSEFGRFINRSKFMRGIGYFMAVTPDGLILCGEHLKSYYVFNTVTNRLIQLPLPPVLHKDASIAIWSRDEGHIYNRTENFDFMYAKSNLFEEPDNILSIQIFSASTGLWRTSTLTSSTAFSLCRGVGIVVRGVLYWMARIGHICYLAAWDANNISDTGHITLIQKPRSCVESIFRARKELPNFLGVSSDGLLQFAACSAGTIAVWVLNDDHLNGQIDADISRWRLCYTIKIFNVVEENFATLLACNIEDRSTTRFAFESFVPGKPGSVYLRHQQHFFICHSDTHKLERIHYYLDDYGYPFTEEPGWWGKRWHRPLTILEPWPSSPFVSSNHY